MLTTSLRSCCALVTEQQLHSRNPNRSVKARCGLRKLLGNASENVPITISRPLCIMHLGHSQKDPLPPPPTNTCVN